MKTTREELGVGEQVERGYFSTEGNHEDIYVGFRHDADPNMHAVGGEPRKAVVLRIIQ